MRDVAERAGVSITTVSHVINETRPVSDELRQRVLAAMQELGYQPNLLARGLRRGETRTIGMIVPDSANPFFAELARGIEDTVFEQGYNVILCNSDGDLDMLKWTCSGTGQRFCLYLHHTDAQREWAYDRKSSIGRLDKGLDEARDRGWTVVDMKTDWNTIYPPDTR